MDPLEDEQKHKQAEEFRFADGEAGKPTLDESTIRKILTEGVGSRQGSITLDFLDVAYDRYKELLENQSLNGADQALALNIFWSLASDIFKTFKQVEFPESLKAKLISDPEWLLEFIKFIGSWEIDPDEIAKWKTKMSPEEEKFFWQIFDRQFYSRVNRGLETFPEPYKIIITEIIEEGIRLHPDKPTAVLDVGCGPLAKAIRDLKNRYKDKIEASGINMEIYDTSSADVNLREGDARNMPYKDDTFDLAYEVGVAGYFKGKDMEAFVAEVMRVLKAQGKFLLTDSYPDLKFLNALGIKYKILREKPFLIEKVN